VNKGPKKDSGDSDSTVAAFLPRIAKANERDVRLYKEARQLYDAKKKLHG
jgi:hypothetical protein